MTLALEVELKTGDLVTVAITGLPAFDKRWDTQMVVSKALATGRLQLPWLFQGSTVKHVREIEETKDNG